MRYTVYDYKKNYKQNSTLFSISQCMTSAVYSYSEVLNRSCQSKLNVKLLQLKKAKKTHYCLL